MQYERVTHMKEIETKYKELVHKGSKSHERLPKSQLAHKITLMYQH